MARIFFMVNPNDLNAPNWTDLDSTANVDKTKHIRKEDKIKKPLNDANSEPKSSEFS